MLILPVISFCGYFIYEFERLEDKHIRLVEGAVDDIRFINVGQGDRASIAQTISKISSCDPAVIAIDIFFPTYDASSIDTLLLRRITDAKPLLATRYKSGHTYAVHSSYLEAANNYGYAELEVNEGYVSHFNIHEKSYKDLYEKNHSNNRVYHFAYEIASTVDSVAAAKYLKDITHPRIPVVISRLTDQFKIYDYQDLDIPCDDLKGKIVYLGYLGPTNEDKHTTYARYHTEEDYEANEPDMYGPIIVANQILMILEGIH